WGTGNPFPWLSYPVLMNLSNLSSQHVLTLTIEVFRPVMIGLGNYSNHILDLLFQAKGWPGGQKQHASLAPHTDIFHYNSTQQPECHLLIFTLQANPRETLTAHRGQRCNQLEPTLNLGDHTLIGLWSVFDLNSRDGPPGESDLAAGMRPDDVVAGRQRRIDTTKNPPAVESAFPDSCVNHAG